MDRMPVPIIKLLSQFFLCIFGNPHKLMIQQITVSDFSKNTYSEDPEEMPHNGKIKTIFSD